MSKSRSPAAAVMDDGAIMVGESSRIMDAMRTVTNVVGNGVATMAVAYWHGERTDLEHQNEDLDSVQAMDFPGRAPT